MLGFCYQKFALLLSALLSNCYQKPNDNGQTMNFKGEILHKVFWTEFGGYDEKATGRKFRTVALPDLSYYLV